MKKILFILCLVPIAFLFFSTKKEVAVNDKDYKPDLFYLGGIQINEANNEDWVNLLKKSDMNTVEVTIYATQGKWDSDSLRFDAEDLKVMDEIRAAKKAGIKVVMILRVHLDRSFDENRFIWHGMIMPRTPELIDSWFSKYNAFAEKWAKIAHEEGVDVFSVGSEMNALSSTIPISSMPSLYAYHNSVKKQKRHEERAFDYKKELKKEDMWVNGYENYSNLKSYIRDRIKRKTAWCNQLTFEGEPNRLALMNTRRKQCSNNWRSVVSTVRKHFDGPLTYAANFDNYLVVDFWDELDFIGINAYFGLRSAADKYENDEQFSAILTDGWEAAFSGVNEFRTKYNLIEKPIIFTELGYINREFSTVEPWAGFGFSVVGYSFYQELVIWGKEKFDYRERNLAMNALFNVVKEKKINLEGLLYWKLTSHDYHMPYEPFALHMTPDAKDSLQLTLAKFATLDD